MFNKVKYYQMVFILALFATPFVAADNIDQKDMTFIFGDIAIEQISELDQMELLSSQEMMETEGQFIPFYALGVGLYHIGRTGYGIYRLTRANSLRGYVSTRAGAIGGVYGTAKYFDPYSR